MAKRIPRVAPVPDNSQPVNARPSASVPGALEVVAGPPPKQRAFLRTAHGSGAATSKVFGGGVSDAPTWSGPDGAGRALGRISVNQPRKTK